MEALIKGMRPERTQDTNPSGTLKIPRDHTYTKTGKEALKISLETQVPGFEIRCGEIHLDDGQ